MREIIGDLWDVDADWICITTNGVIRKDGRATMGRGCAFEAKRYCPGIDLQLGYWLQNRGNHVHFLGSYVISDRAREIVSFPTKHDWRDPSSLTLIEQSCRELVEALKESYYYLTTPKVCIPRPGCGNGQLSWNAVKPVLEKYFSNDYDIHIVSKEE